MRYQLLDPVVEPFVPEARLAPRLDGLAGKRIGLWSNRKINTTALLDECEVILRERHRIGSVQRGTYDAARVMRPDEWVGVDGCDAVLLTHGD